MTKTTRSPPASEAASNPPPQAGNHDHDDIGTRPVMRVRWWQSVLVVLVVAGFASGLFYGGWLPKARQSLALEHDAGEVRRTLPRVQVTQPRPGPTETVLMLPADIEAIEETTIYPRTSGYLKKWFVDIGDEVRQGQLLAEIDSPEIDQQLRQAVANVEQLNARKKVAETRFKLARLNLHRIEALPVGIRTQQDLEERQAEVEVADYTVKVAEADIQAGMAELQRVKELQAFSKVYAPFAGTITARTIELGQLVTSGNDLAQSLFRLSRTDTVRVIVHVPQMYAPSIQPNQTAELVVREMPGRIFPGTITRTAKSIDLQTRTLLTEIEVANPDGLLLTGSYVQARMTAKRDNPPVIIPASALIFNSEGTTVAVVDDQNHIQLRDVEVDGDYGTSLGIATGLSATDRIVVNPGDRLKEGQSVTVESSEEKASAKTASAH